MTIVNIYDNKHYPRIGFAKKDRAFGVVNKTKCIKNAQFL